ncbi:MAG: type I-B CRISPR-associated protein Cas7/Cst2/DevR [Candidatus Cloacimonetes bacterium]|nr:type I-B CRISPR-associated protein Cas7/Cst2/DevR [Candidatus Cloacimonadota bacterium]
MENNLKTQGFVLLDVDAVALNNAGKSTTSNFDNAVATKTIFKNGKSYVYVSGQAWRYWWREALQKNLGWKLSPVTRENKIAFTNANPIEFPDDDVFGYMRAASEEVVDENGKKKNVNITVTRISPLKNSAIVSAASVRPVENWSSMARQEGDAVPYAKQEYSAIMKGMFSLDLDMVGTFSNYNKTGYQNLSDKLKAEALERGAVEIVDNFVENQKLIQLPRETRISRVIDTISALKNISGGAMQTNNMGDVTPKFIVLATTNTGNHPFSHIVKSTGDRDEVVVLNIEGLEEILNEYKDNFVGKVFIGKRSGFFDDENDALKKLQEKFSEIVVLASINGTIDRYCEQLKSQIQ